MLALMLALQAAVQVKVENTIAIERRDETVAIAWAQLPGFAANRVRVRDAATGKEVVSQVLDANGDAQPDSLLFQVSLWPNDARTFAIEPQAPSEKPKSKVHVKFAVPREDIAWESDRIAFRAYSKKLWELENLHTNGIDVWVKRTRELVLDSWYDKGHDSYHIDTGEGADYYSVGTTLGAGGVGLWKDGRIHRGDNFQQHRIIADGPIRAVFELDYLPIDAAGSKATEKKRISIDANSNFYKQESTFTSDAAELQVVVGLVKRADAVGSTSRARGWYWITNWAPIQASTRGHGELGLAALIDKNTAVEVAEVEDHFVAIGKAKPGLAFVSYVGAGWTSSRDFQRVEDWWKLVDNLAQRLSKPLVVSVVK